MIELERTFLAKYLPDLSNCKSKEIIDVYIPKTKEYPTLRIRKNGNQFEITKKEIIDDDPSEHREETIKLTEKEWEALSSVDGKKVHKIRYFFQFKDRIAEIDVFQGSLKGLVVVDFEFDNKQDKDDFQIPDFCLVDVTPEVFIAGGVISGKSYQDIEQNLNKLNYKKLLGDFNG